MSAPMVQPPPPPRRSPEGNMSSAPPQQQPSNPFGAVPSGAAPILAAAAASSFNHASASSRLAGLLPTRWSLQGLREYKDSKLQNWRPFSDFLDYRRVRTPGSWSMVKERGNNNLSYYSTNYMFVFSLICLYALISSPFLLISLTFLAVSYHFINSSSSPTLTVFGRSYSTTQLNTYLAVLSIPLLWLGSAGSTVFWIVGLSAVVIGGHAAILEPPVERAFEEAV